MVIRNKCYNTCFYLHDRFRIRKLFLVCHDTLHGRSLSIYGSECQIWKLLLRCLQLTFPRENSRKNGVWERKMWQLWKDFALKGKSYNRKSFNANRWRLYIKRFAYEFTSMFLIWQSIQIRISPKRGKCTWNSNL